ncbi:hypothetical protein KAI04_00410 [Candidatus Pacearchaeota archaeon]|nr:hypothetical protein [Candidatus Pacearchaeota archaeon]
MVDVSQLTEDMKNKIDKNPDKVIESPSLSKFQAEKLEENLSNYHVLGLIPLNIGAMDCSSYVLAVTYGGKNA